MKAYVTSIGEKTTDICVAQLYRYGFEVILLDQVEPWIDKYKRFIAVANDGLHSCLRVDADTIVNKNIEDVGGFLKKGGGQGFQFKAYSLYANDIVPKVVLYSPEALGLIAKKVDILHLNHRPETDAWRLKETKDELEQVDLIVGMVGFFQDYQHFHRHVLNKAQRGQMAYYDFDLAAKLLDL